MKRYMNMALLYAVLAMVGGVFYREFTKINGFTAKTTLAVVPSRCGILPFAGSSGKEFFLYRTKDRTSIGCLSYRVESDCCYVCCARDSSGTRDCAFRRYGRGNFRYCRNRTHPAGDQYGTSVDADQAECCREG